MVHRGPRRRRGCGPGRGPALRGRVRGPGRRAVPRRPVAARRRPAGGRPRERRRARAGLNSTVRRWSSARRGRFLGGRATEPWNRRRISSPRWRPSSTSGRSRPVRLGVRAALIDGDLVEGDLRIEDGEVREVGVTPAGRVGIAAPGFVDLHINGVAGVDFWTADPGGYRRAAEALASTGVIAFQPTFVSAPVDGYAPALATASAARVELDGAGLPRLAGVHLEGPFLAPQWAGAHDPAHLLAPDPGLAASLCEQGPVTMLTLAPELPGGLDLVDRLVAAGVAVSIGHSDADSSAAHAAFDRGARAITHIFNAHRRWQPRDPGLAGAAIVRPDVFVEAIVDGVHLAPDAAYGTFLAARDRYCLVTDAVEAAMAAPGDYRLADRPVRVADGAVRLADGTLAGSVLTMDRAVRNLVAGGAPPAQALRAASGAPARLLRRADLGAIAPGAPAHLVVLDDELRVRRTLIGGAEAFAAG
ncbi:MAG: amidohydrolase family protein [Solirubrobacterales bacterium]|nr:amidohydrolase family protein [Solirubrobacterales bacterium]